MSACFISGLHSTEHETQALPNLGLSPGSDVDDDGCDVDDVVAAATSVWILECGAGVGHAWEPPMMREEGVQARDNSSPSLCVRMHGRTRIWISRGKRRISRCPVGRSADFLRCLCGQTTVAKRREAADSGILFLVRVPSKMGRLCTLLPTRQVILVRCSCDNERV